MNFLQLVQRTARECAASGTIDTLVDASGETLLFKDWVATAWQELQTKNPDWTWMRASNLLGSGVSFATVNGTYQYPLGAGAGTVGVAAAAFAMWDKDSFRCYTTANGIGDEDLLPWIDYDAWRNGYMVGAQRSVRTRPIVMSIGPGEAVVLGPPPTAAYTVTGDYFTAPSEMSVDTSEPTGLPLPFHMLIVYMAMLSYAGYESAPEVEARAQKKYGPLMRRLERLRAQPLSAAGALA